MFCFLINHERASLHIELFLINKGMVHLTLLCGTSLGQDSHCCYLFLGDTPSSETGLSFWEDYFTPVNHESCKKQFPKDLIFVTLSAEWVTQGFVRRRVDCVRHVHHTCDARCTYDTHSQSAGTCFVGWKNSVIWLLSGWHVCENETVF